MKKLFALSIFVFLGLYGRAMAFMEGTDYDQPKAFVQRVQAAGGGVTILAADTFNRSDSSLGNSTASDGVSTWTARGGTNSRMQVIANHSTTTVYSANNDGFYIKGSSPTDADWSFSDSYSQASTGKTGVAICGHMGGVGDGRGACFFWNGGGGWQGGDFTGGTYTQKTGADQTCTDPTSTVTRKVQFVGTTATLFINGTTCQSFTTVNLVGYAGYWLYFNEDANTYNIDNAEQDDD